MIVSETPNRVKSRRLQALVLLCATVVLPLGMVYAQDGQGAGRLDAAGAEIRKAIAEGKITAEEGRKKMQAIRNAASAKSGAVAKSEHAQAEAKAHLEKLAQELKAAVEAGKISEEDAKKKYAALKKTVKEKMAAGDRKSTAAREYLAKLHKELWAAVKAGKISEEDAKKKFAAAEKAIREKMAAQGGGDAEKRAGAYLEGARKRIEAAVKNGDMTREEAAAKLQEIREGLKKRMEDAAKRGGEARPNWDGIKKRIEGAVERGDMTREEAVAKYKEIREQMAKGRQP